MRADARAVMAFAALGAALASTGYALFAANRLRAFAGRLARQRAARAPAGGPTVTLLKPIKGPEPELDANLRSFCEQRYARYDVVTGVQRADDPELATMRRVCASYPDRARVVVGDGSAHFRNPKVANLTALVPEARGELLVITDGDMRVGPDYLDAVVAPFADPNVGAVTCVYRGEPAGDGLASALGAMWITEQFAPSVLVADAVEPTAYTFGSTMAVRRRTFAAFGGLRALGDELADDYALGRLVAAQGSRVALAPYVVENIVAEPGLRALIAHQVRWHRTIRSVRLAGYAGLLLTFPVPLALAHLALSRRRRAALAVFAAAVAARVLLHRAAHAALGTRRRPHAALIPLSDALAVTTWVAGFFGHRVHWRGETLRLSVTRSPGGQYLGA